MGFIFRYKHKDIVNNAENHHRDYFLAALKALNWNKKDKKGDKYDKSA